MFPGNAPQLGSQPFLTPTTLPPPPKRILKLLSFVKMVINYLSSDSIRLPIHFSASTRWLERISNSTHNIHFIETKCLTIYPSKCICMLTFIFPFEHLLYAKQMAGITVPHSIFIHIQWCVVRAEFRHNPNEGIFTANCQPYLASLNCCIRIFQCV